MKAFLLSLVALVVISAIAAVGLSMLEISSSENSSQSGNVRL